MVTCSFLAYDGIHLILFHDILLSYITCVKIQLLAFIALVQQLFEPLGIVYTGRSRVIGEYYLVALVHLGVLLVAIEGLTTLLCPAGINVLVAFLVRIVIPQLVATTLLYHGVFLTGVTLARGNYEACINDAPLIKLKPLGFHEITELVE